MDRAVGLYVQRQGQGSLCLRDEWSDDRPELPQEYQRAQEGRLARCLRPLSGGNQRVLESAGYLERRDEADQYDGLSSAGRRLRRERWYVRQLSTLASMEVRRNAASRISEGRPRDSGAHLFESARSLQG